MSLRYLATICIAVLLLLTISGGGLMHAVVPHKHSHGAAQESSIWALLHSSLRHEQKKFLFDIAPILATFLIVLALVRIAPLRLVLVHIETSSRDPLRGRALMRGIVPYRRFG